MRNALPILESALLTNKMFGVGWGRPGFRVTPDRPTGSLNKRMLGVERREPARRGFLRDNNR